MNTTQKDRMEVLARLARLGIASEDAQALRRISLTLRRWFELECNGDISRDEITDLPYAHYGRGTKGPFLTARIPDRETGAKKRLARILAKYPSLHAYVQTDPRGAALYLLTSEQVAWNGGSIEQLDSIYSRGTAIY